MSTTKPALFACPAHGCCLLACRAALPLACLPVTVNACRPACRIPAALPARYGLPPAVIAAACLPFSWPALPAACPRFTRCRYTFRAAHNGP